MLTLLKVLAAPTVLSVLLLAVATAGAGQWYSESVDGWVLAKCEQGFPPGDRTAWAEAHWNTFYACLKEQIATGEQSAAHSPPAITYTPAERPAGVIRYQPGQAIMVSVTFNGLATVRLLLDTGAETSAVKPGVLEAAGVDLSRPAARGEGSVPGGGKFKVSYYTVTLEAAGHRVLVPHVAAISKYAGDEDGLLGRDFLDRFKVVVDPASATVTLVPR